MTRKEIIEMARQAGFLDYELDDGTTDAFDKRYEAFAKLVAEHERYACAKVCDGYSDGRHANMADLCAEAIRARGNHD